VEKFLRKYKKIWIYFVPYGRREKYLKQDLEKIGKKEAR